jgi:hypothetical protein
MPTDSSLAPSVDSTFGAGISTLAGAAAPGIPFGAFNMKSQYLTPVVTGWLQALEPTWLLGELVGARAKGARVVIKLTGGPDNVLQNADGTFSLTKWKALLARFKTVNFSSYITDGTILGLYLIDEPQHAAKWGGKIIPQTTVEEMARYSKSLWPTMVTFARVPPSWLAASSITYTYLDAAWIQYEGGPNMTTWIASEVAAAKRKGLGLVTGLNVLNGGTSASGIPGTKTGKWAMSASQVQNYGTALLNQPYTCGFLMWMYSSTYFARSDIKSALAGLSTKANAHVKTSCRQ